MEASRARDRFVLVTDNRESLEEALEENDGVRLTAREAVGEAEVRPPNAEWSPGRASHHQISPIKCRLQPIMTAQGRIRGRMPILLSLSAAGRSNLGNPG